MISYDFTGRHGVVTGAGGGMGEAIAAALLAAGASVTALDLKPQPASLAGHGARLNYQQGDLTDESFVTSRIAEAGHSLGPVDYLANVAGCWFGRDKSALEMDLELWDQVFAINLKSFVLTARACVPLMRQTGARRRDGAFLDRAMDARRHHAARRLSGLQGGRLRPVEIAGDATRRRRYPLECDLPRHGRCCTTLTS
jgi:NAD(P)-dependent dehydrogenase (short-subunit alcohol dehydrogenase family)